MKNAQQTSEIINDDTDEIFVEDTENFSSQKKEVQPLASRNEQLRVVEALIFSSAQAVEEKEIRDRLPEDADLDSLLAELRVFYARRGFNLVQRGNAWVFRTADDLGDVLQHEVTVTKKLSKAAMETLSVIAYHQPVTRAEIENIRGVAVSKGTLDLLMDEGWITIGRRREIPGRPVTWKTTQNFLDMFGLETLKDLPGLAEIKAAGLLDTRPAIEVTGGYVSETKDMFDEDENLTDNDEMYDSDLTTETA